MKGKTIWRRIGFSFAISLLCGLIINVLIEMIVLFVTGNQDFSPMSPEFIALFPTDRIAAQINVLLYGLIGAAFSAGTVIYEQERIGYLLQNMLYFLATALVWIPVVMVLWQLYRYPQAFISTILCFFLTNVVMSILGYRMTKRDVTDINAALSLLDSDS